MMPRAGIVVLLALALSGLTLRAQDVPDREAAVADSLDREAARFAPLDSLLNQFYGALMREETESKNAEFDRLIASCQDSLTRQHVALAIFDHYRFSRLMGEEAVAVHIYDEWIASGKVQMRGEFERFEADRFALENRKTLLGMPAPQITLRKPCGGRVTIPRTDRASVLYFYSPDCAKCRLSTYALPSVLAEVDFPMDFYAIDVASDRREWRAFRKALKTSNKQVKMIHLWDPDNESTLLLDYGVFSTPKLFVVWEGEILGRRLEMANLQEIIQYINLLYGQEKED
ncbi:MAG: thioredoxin family protein [Bacteroidales bacterium]|nr:thioredoxin family protein [Bacteroidales bacterium]